MKTCKHILLGILIAILVFCTQTAKADLIEEIIVPMVGATYNSGTGIFAISGYPSSGVSVFYNDEREPNPVVYNLTSFLLTTQGLDLEITNGGYTATYTQSSMPGIVNLTQLSGPTLLTGDLTSLTLSITDPNLGTFSGTGEFLATGGSLLDDFGLYGDVLTVGLTFDVPVSFYDPFVAAITNTRLSDPPQPVPEPSTMLLLGSGLLGVGWFARRKFMK